MEIKKKVTLPDQLKCLSIGDEVIIKARLYKIGTVRSAVRRLNLTHKYQFAVTEKGLIDSCIVKRVS
jgi:hypothetical protein